MKKNFARYAVIDPAFVTSDARFANLRPLEQYAYLRLWIHAVNLGRETIPSEGLSPSYLSRALGVHWNTIYSMIEKASFCADHPLVRAPLPLRYHSVCPPCCSRSLLVPTLDGGLTICGITKLHPGLFPSFIHSIIQKEDAREKKRAPTPSASPGGEQKRSKSQSKKSASRVDVPPPVGGSLHEAVLGCLDASGKWNGKGVDVPDIVYREDRAKIQQVLTEKPHLIPKFNGNARLSGFVETHAQTPTP